MRDGERPVAGRLRRTSRYRAVCRGGNSFDVPGNARCAVRLGLQGVSYSDSRDGFRVCLGVPKVTLGEPAGDAP